MVQYLMAYLNARHDEEGQGLVEYALIIALIAVVCFVALQTLGGTVNGVFEDINGKL